MNFVEFNDRVSYGNVISFCSNAKKYINYFVLIEKFYPNDKKVSERILVKSVCVFHPDNQDGTRLQ